MSHLDASEPQPVNRACESCRMLKVRCLPDETSSSGICLRCGKSGRNCIFAAPQKRKQRKRTDTRVAELEKEVRAMRLLLEKNGSSAIPEDEVDKGNDSEESDEHDQECARSGKINHLWADTEARGISSKSRSRTPNDDGSILTTLPSDPMPSRDRSFPVQDVIDRGLVTEKVAGELFDSYNKDLVQHFPGVLLSPTMQMSELRRSKPALFLAVITAACCNYDSELYGTLFDENARLFAESIFINGEKSLELVQALFVTSVWYCPPHEVATGSTLRFYQYIHMSATMALDIGLGTQIDPSAMSLEKSRTICACYLACAGVAMRMRRPNMLRWTSWMTQCLDLLEKSPASVFLDKRLAAWVKLQIITDDYANFFSFDDPSTTVNLGDTRMQVTLKGFERQLEDWKRTTPADVMNESLIMSYYQNSIFLHERIAIDGHFDDKENFNHKLFNPPQAVSTFSLERNTPGLLNAAYVNAVMACIDSMHSLLDVFLGMAVHTLRPSPIVVYVRTSYSIVVLIKLYISTFASNIGSVLDRRVLKIDYYLGACMEKLRVTSAAKKYRVPSKWLIILGEIKIWYLKYSTVFNQNDRAASSGTDLQHPRLQIDDPNECPATVNSRNSGNLHLSFFPTEYLEETKSESTAAHVEKNSRPLFDSTADPIAWALPYSDLSSDPPAGSSHMAAFDPLAMDYVPNDFIFLDQPGDSVEGTTTWMTESNVLGDLNFVPSSFDWSPQPH